MPIGSKPHKCKGNSGVDADRCSVLNDVTPPGKCRSVVEAIGIDRVEQEVLLEQSRARARSEEEIRRKRVF